jgi:hypothetical protein
MQISSENGVTAFLDIGSDAFPSKVVRPLYIVKGESRAGLKEDLLTLIRRQEKKAEEEKDWEDWKNREEMMDGIIAVLAKRTTTKAKAYTRSRNSRREDTSRE